MEEAVLLRILDQLLLLTPAMKNAMYHQISEIIKNNDDKKEQATQIVIFIMNLFDDIKNGALEKLDDQEAGKVSSIFRRIG